MRKNQFFTKMKEDKGARAIAITVSLMVLVLSAVIVTTVIANPQSKDRPSLVYPSQDGSTQTGLNDPDEKNNQQDGKEEKPDKPSEPDKPTDVLPEHFLLPVSGVLLKAHNTEVQVFSQTMKDYRMHLGIDIGTVAGASVSAMADGVISQIWDDVKMGHCVAVKHGGEAYTIYKNLAADETGSLKVGMSVKAGDVIGKVGDSAMTEIAEDPHLHLEMTVGGLQVNPTDYLDKDALATLSEDTNYEDVS